MVAEKFGRAAEMVTHVSEPIISVILTNGSITSTKISIAAISASTGIKSVRLSSSRVAHNGCCCSKTLCNI